MAIKSRRAFLTGQVPTLSEWVKFQQRLAQEVGPEQLVQLPSCGQARFVPRQSGDVHGAFALAQHFDIQLALFTAQQVSQAEQFVAREGLLWIDPVHLNRCEVLDEQGRLYVEPGCTLGQLVAAGCEQFAPLPAALRFIEWLADPQYQQGRALMDSGLQMASLLLADCSVARLGPFGVDAQMQLNTPALRRIVPQLFQLVHTERVQRCLELPVWPARYRLDAFVDSKEVNLAYLVLGQGLQLGWLQWAVLDPQSLTVGTPLAAPPAQDEQTHRRVQGIERTVRELFDPGQRFLALL